MTATNITVSPAKLADGSWGVSYKGELRPGTIVTVKTRAGKTWDTEITSWETVGSTRTTYRTRKICTPTTPRVSRSRHGGGRRGGRRTGCSCGSREGVIQNSDCFTCKHDADY